MLISPISPFSFLLVSIFRPSGKYQTLRNRRNVRFLGNGGWGMCVWGREERRAKTPTDVGFDVVIPHICVPRGSVIGCPLCPSAHYPFSSSQYSALQSIRRAPNPPKRWVFPIRMREGSEKFGKRGNWTRGHRSDFFSARGIRSPVGGVAPAKSIRRFSCTKA